MRLDVQIPCRIRQEPRPIRSMSETARDVSAQTDLKKLKLEADGSFNRAPSTFRDIIQGGSKYEPEKGICHYYSATTVIYEPSLGS